MTPASHIGTALHLYNTKSIGNVTLKTISASPTASVVGVTSRGIFLHTPSKQTIFISFEPHRGPLTINITQKITAYRGESAQIIDSHLLIGDAAICLDAANLWQPDPVPANIVPLPQRLATLQYFLNRAQIVIPSEARNLLDNPIDSSSRYALLGMTKLEESLILNLGRGSGLTPSHDDLVIGFLLTLNRYSHYSYNDLIIKEAYTRTTTLSANLIECAAQGLADERLIRVIDCIFTGNKDDEALDAMLGWGESSGSHALLGMSMAIHSG